MPYSKPYLVGHIARQYLQGVRSRAKRYRLANEYAALALSKEQSPATPQQPTVQELHEPLLYIPTLEPKLAEPPASDFRKLARSLTSGKRHSKITDPLYVPPLGTLYGVLPDGNSWPTQTYSGSAECLAAIERGHRRELLRENQVPEIIQFLKRVWGDLVDDQRVAQFVIKQIDRSAEVAITNLKLNGHSPKAVTWLSENVPNIETVYDRVLQQSGIARLTNENLGMRFRKAHWAFDRKNPNKVEPGDKSYGARLAEYRALATEYARRLKRDSPTSPASKRAVARADMGNMISAP